MQRWGKTRAGTQRYRCRLCATTAVRSRPDSRARIYQRLFVRWLTKSTHLVGLARENHCTIRTLQTRFKSYWSFEPRPKCPSFQPTIIVLDGLGIVSRRLVVLVIQDPLHRQPISWTFASHESYEHWLGALYPLRKAGINPTYAVCDGQRGLLKALSAVWPNIKLQRCLIHVIRQARAWLTQRPKTPAGQVLLCLVKDLLMVRTRRQRRRWIRRYRRWLTRYDNFFKERTYSTGVKRRWWYTHRKLRAVRSLITNSLPYLFTFVRYPEVPRTSNHVEGGINSRLKDLMRIHRGLPPERKRILVAWYLATRQGQKPTRNFY